MRNFRNLRAWHLAHEISLSVPDSLPERTSRRIPGLRSQAISAAGSIPANLAEGCARPSERDFLHFVDIAIASLAELESHLLRARDGLVLESADYDTLTTKLIILKGMLLSLSRTLQHSIALEENTAKKRQRPFPPSPT